MQKALKQRNDATLAELADQFGVSHKAIWYALRRLKISRKKTWSYVEAEHYEHRRRPYLNTLAKLLLTGERIVYVDETGFERSTQRDHGRAPRGQKVYGTRSGRQRPRTSLIGALIDGALTAPLLFEGTCNTDLFTAWLATFLVPHLKKGMVIVMDNATFHRLTTTRDIIEKAGCRLLFLPPYSPELNPIEKTWATIKPQRKYHAQLSLDQLIVLVG